MALPPLGRPCGSRAVWHSCLLPHSPIFLSPRPQRRGFLLKKEPPNPDRFDPTSVKLGGSDAALARIMPKKPQNSPHESTLGPFAKALSEIGPEESAAPEPEEPGNSGDGDAGPEANPPEDGETPPES
jgi:hypothetical protein